MFYMLQYWFVNILLRIFILMFMAVIGLQCPFNLISLFGFGIRVVLAMKCWKMFSPSLYPKQICIGVVLFILWMFHRTSQWIHLVLELLFCGNVLGAILFFKKDCFSVSYVAPAKFHSPKMVVFDDFVQFYAFILLRRFANLFILPHPEDASLPLHF